MCVPVRGLAAACKYIVNEQCSRHEHIFEIDRTAQLVTDVCVCSDVFAYSSKDVTVCMPSHSFLHCVYKWSYRGPCFAAHHRRIRQDCSGF